jgi:hypothetical protein
MIQIQSCDGKPCARAKPMAQVIHQCSLRGGGNRHLTRIFATFGGKCTTPVHHALFWALFGRGVLKSDDLKHVAYRERPDQESRHFAAFDVVVNGSLRFY